jgi:hypothetical protein
MVAYVVYVASITPLSLITCNRNILIVIIKDAFITLDVLLLLVDYVAAAYLKNFCV